MENQEFRTCESVLKAFHDAVKLKQEAKKNYISADAWMNASAILNILMHEEEKEWIAQEQIVSQLEERYQEEGMTSARAKNKVKASEEYHKLRMYDSLRRSCNRFMSNARKMSDNLQYG